MIIQNIEGNTYLINLGKVEAFLPPREQVPGEKFNVKDRISKYQNTNLNQVVTIDLKKRGIRMNQ